MRAARPLIDRHLGVLLARGSANVGDAGEMGRLMVMMTRSCELRCSYCFIALDERHFGREHPGTPARVRRAPPRGDLSAATFRRGIDVLMTSRKARLGLQLFGGEPTRRLETVLDGLSWALAHPRRAGRPIELLLTTNGLRLGDDELRALAPLPVTVQLSLDGDATGSRFRRGFLVTQDDATTAVRGAVERLRDSGLRWFMNATLPPAAAGEVFARYAWARALGLPALQLNYATGMTWSAAQRATYIRGIIQVLEAHARDPGNLALLNWQNGADPVPLCGDVILDVDGAFLMTGAIFHERRFPSLGRAPGYRLGSVDDVTSFDEIRVPLDRLYERTREALTPPEWRIFSGNVRFGAAVDLAIQVTARRFGRAAA